MEPSKKAKSAAPGEKRFNVDRLIAWSTGLSTFAVIIALLYFTVPPVYREARVWRATQFAAAGTDALAAENWEDAILQFRLARQLDPDNIAYLRDLARASESISFTRASEVWRDVMGRRDISTVERQDFVEFLLRAGRPDLATEHLMRLMRTKPPSARSMSLSSDFFDKMGDRERATIYARAALNAAPGDDEIQFKLGALLAGDDTAAERAYGRKLLWELSGRTNSMQLEAWKRLSETGELNASEADKVLGWLKASPHLGKELLLEADLSLQAEPSRRDQIVASLIPRIESTNDVALGDAVSWLNKKSAFPEASDLLPFNRIGTNVLLLGLSLDTHVGLKDWAGIEVLLANTNAPVEPVLAECVRAHVASKQGNEAQARRRWTALIEWGSTNFPVAAVVARQAEQGGLVEFALKAYEPHVNNSNQPRIGLEANRQTFRIAQKLGRFDVARDAATRLARFDSENHAAVASAVYLNLLLKSHVRQALESANALIRINPEQPNHKILAAFGHLRLGDSKKAQALLDELPVPIAAFSPQWRAIGAAVYKANGRLKEQVQLMQSLDNSGFRKEELKLVMD